MSREVDRDLVRRRTDATSTLAMASRDVDALSDKCAELASLVYDTFQQSATGEAMTRSLEAAAAFLSDSGRAIGSAIASAHGIDVTVEVPDEE